jgi:hypothetical protein
MIRSFARIAPGAADVREPSPRVSQGKSAGFCNDVQRSESRPLKMPPGSKDEPASPSDLRLTIGTDHSTNLGIGAAVKHYY